MKKFTLYTMLLLGFLTLSPVQSFASGIVPPAAVSTNPNEVPAHVKVMLDRLEEIKAMDKSGLTRVEKKALRKEVKALKSSLKASGNGVYLSVGAIIIIVLLLILLL